MSGGLFKKSSLGLDAGEDYIKFVELINAKDGVRVGRHGEHEIHNKKGLKEALSSLKKIFGSKPVHVSLPHLDRENMEEYIIALRKSGIKVKSAEHHTDAVARSVVRDGDPDAYMIVDMGPRNSNIFIVSEGVLGYHVSAPGAIYLLRDEIAKHFLSWHAHPGNKPRIHKIIVCGSGPNLVEFCEYLSANMRHRAEPADVWVNILDTSKHVPEISLHQSFGFAAAVGVALKGL